MRSEVPSQFGKERVEGKRGPQVNASRPVHMRALWMVVLERRQALESAQCVWATDNKQVV